jgi:hypothetical protein
VLERRTIVTVHPGEKGSVWKIDVNPGITVIHLVVSPSESTRYASNFGSRHSEIVGGKAKS